MDNWVWFLSSSTVVHTIILSADVNLYYCLQSDSSLFISFSRESVADYDEADLVSGCSYAFGRHFSKLSFVDDMLFGNLIKIAVVLVSDSLRLDIQDSLFL